MKEQLFDPLTTVVEHEEEIVVHWVNKHGIPMDVKTRKGGLIHALWLAEHEKRTKLTSDIRPLTSDIEIQPEILSIDEQHSS